MKDAIKNQMRVINRINERLETLEQKLEFIDDRIVSTEQKIVKAFDIKDETSHESRLKELESNNTYLHSELNKLEQRIKEFSGEINSLKGDICYDFGFMEKNRDVLQYILEFIEGEHLPCSDYSFNKLEEMKQKLGGSLTDDKVWNIEDMDHAEKVGYNKARQEIVKKLQKSIGKIYDDIEKGNYKKDKFNYDDEDKIYIDAYFEIGKIYDDILRELEEK